MPTEAKSANLILHIEVGEDTDEEELDRLTRLLLDEIQEIDVESVELVGDEAVPEGAKSVEVAELGMLAVQVLPTAVSALVNFLQAWSRRGEGRTVKIKTQKGDQTLEVAYDPKTMSSAELKMLVETVMNN